MTAAEQQVAAGAPGGGRIAWREGLPLVCYHLGSLFVFAVGFSWAALVAAIVVYWMMIFGISVGYHRYFSHRSYKTSRWFQFALALLGAISAQMGPLWWSSHHRRHHRFADREGDVHSPKLTGFWNAHIGWILRENYVRMNENLVRDWLKFPELVWLDRHRHLPPLALAAGLYGLGAWLGAAHPALGTSGPQLLVWGFFLTTTVMYHVTFCVNSVSHVFGRRAFDTPDASGNLFWLALLTNGEGWHNNHHRYPGSARQGFFWWEIDVSLYVLRLLRLLGVVWDLREPPEAVYAEARRNRALRAGAPAA